MVDIKNYLLDLCENYYTLEEDLFSQTDCHGNWIPIAANTEDLIKSIKEDLLPIHEANHDYFTLSNYFRKKELYTLLNDDATCHEIMSLCKKKCVDTKTRYDIIDLYPNDHLLREEYRIKSDTFRYDILCPASIMEEVINDYQQVLTWLAQDPEIHTFTWKEDDADMYTFSWNGNN